VDATTAEARLRPFFEEERGAVAVYLFGSVARDEARHGSDVDVGVLFGEDPPATLAAPQFAIEARLERLLGLRLLLRHRAAAEVPRFCRSFVAGPPVL